MGTRVDFYIGRDPETMEWIGSRAWDGYPDGIPEDVLAAYTEPRFRAAVARMAEGRDDWTTPEMGWPWPWGDSGLTDYTYAFDVDEHGVGRVWATGGHGWWVAAEEEPDDDTGPRVQFPDMSDRQRVTLGRRSGVIVVGR